MNQLLSQKQLSEAIGVSSLTLIEWRKAGIITPKIHEKHVIRYDLTEVQSILAERAKNKSK
jgi:predicted site-specific integrase-resolvase